jgi:serine/threonine protein phosphatase PrpC
MTPTPIRSVNESLPAKSGVWRRTRWLFSVFTLQGTDHNINQDSFNCRPDHFWGVADGVGGGDYGEVASHLLLESMAALVKPMPNEIKLALKETDARIDSHIRSLGKGMGAAVMACLWTQSSTQCLAVHVGDCKILHLERKSGLWQYLWTSSDQSYAYEGLLPPPGVSLHAPANMVGSGMSSDPLIHELYVRNNERVILCSDGFSSHLNNPFVVGMVEKDTCPLQSGVAQTWCEGARKVGSQDDITVLIVERKDQLTAMSWLAILFFVVLIFIFYLYLGSWV